MKSLYKKHFNWYERNLKYTKEQMAKQLFEIGVINNFISHQKCYGLGRPQMLQLMI